MIRLLCQELKKRDFPLAIGGPVAKNPPFSARDTRPVPGPGRCRRAAKPAHHSC